MCSAERDWEINSQKWEFEPTTFWIPVRHYYHKATWTSGRGVEGKSLPRGLNQIQIDSHSPNAVHHNWVFKVA